MDAKKTPYQDGRALLRAPAAGAGRALTAPHRQAAAAMSRSGARCQLAPAPPRRYCRYAACAAGCRRLPLCWAQPRRRVLPLHLQPGEARGRADERKKHGLSISVVHALCSAASLEPAGMPATLQAWTQGRTQAPHLTSEGWAQAAWGRAPRAFLKQLQGRHGAPHGTGWQASAGINGQAGTARTLLQLGALRMQVLQLAGTAPGCARLPEPGEAGQAAHGHAAAEAAVGLGGTHLSGPKGRSVPGTAARGA